MAGDPEITEAVSTNDVEVEEAKPVKTEDAISTNDVEPIDVEAPAPAPKAAKKGRDD